MTQTPYILARTQTFEHKFICTPWLSIEKLMRKYSTVTYCTQSTSWYSCNISSVNGCKHQQSFAVAVCTITFSNTQSLKLLISDPCKWVCLFFPDQLTVLLVFCTWNTLQIIYITQIIWAAARSVHQKNKTMSIKENNALGRWALKRETRLKSYCWVQRCNEHTFITLSEALLRLHRNEKTVRMIHCSAYMKVR